MSAPNDNNMNNSMEKPRLSAEQKKANHIESERKRRDNLRAKFEKLAGIVPDCEGQARSEGTVLAATVNYIKELQAKKEELKTEALDMGMSELEFEQHYRDAAQRAQDQRDGKEPSEPIAKSGSVGRRGGGSSRPGSSGSASATGRASRTNNF